MFFDILVAIGRDGVSEVSEALQLGLFVPPDGYHLVEGQTLVRVSRQVVAGPDVALRVVGHQVS